ncbi:MAG: nicotinate-nucleotide adenylyltransferase, partial [Chloroflexota bacterium]|nr:nicotinate-nucleotide adenylyltransferase [Chloroflexota bacterium]
MTPTPGTATADPGDAAAIRPGSIGILGGTFDPFHLGHLGLARAARDQLGLERLLVIPAAEPPHKPARPISPAAVRLRLVEAGIAREPRLEASPIELERAGPSYTVDTVAALADAERAAGREPDLTVILSAESFAGLPTWHEPERLLELARIAVAPRAGHPRPDPDWISARFPGREDRIAVMDGPELDISASAIRRRAAAGESLIGLVPAGVENVISTD